MLYWSIYLYVSKSILLLLSLRQVCKKAFLLGISTYAIFEFTTMAIFKDWSYQMVIIDTLWGGILYSLTTYILRAFFT